MECLVSPPCADRIEWHRAAIHLPIVALGSECSKSTEENRREGKQRTVNGEFNHLTQPGTDSISRFA